MSPQAFVQLMVMAEDSDKYIHFFLLHLEENCALLQIFQQANTSFKRWILDFATKRKEAELRSGIIRNNSLWDKIIFRKVQVT